MSVRLLWLSIFVLCVSLGVLARNVSMTTHMLDCQLAFRVTRVRSCHWHSAAQNNRNQMMVWMAFSVEGKSILVGSQTKASFSFEKYRLAWRRSCVEWYTQYMLIACCTSISAQIFLCWIFQDYYPYCSFGVYHSTVNPNRFIRRIKIHNLATHSHKEYFFSLPQLMWNCGCLNDWASHMTCIFSICS